MSKRNFFYLVFFLFILFRLLPMILNPSNPLRSKLELTFALHLPNSEAGLLSGIVLGTKKSLPAKLYEQMKQTGTLHIAVASGMNVVLLANPTLAFLTIFFKRKIALIPLFILIWFYAFLTGFEPPIVRASLMLSLVFLAQEFGRQADNLRILALTALVMLLFSPQLLFNLSFQLSFGSMLGLFFIQPILKKSKNFLLKSETFSSTLACQLATLPIIMVNFGEYNLLSPLINFLVLWTVPYIFGIGLISAFLSFVSSSLTKLLLILFYPLMWYFVTVVELTSRVKIFQIWTPKWSWGVGVGYYFILGWWVYQKHIRN